MFLGNILFLRLSQCNLNGKIKSERNLLGQSSYCTKSFINFTNTSQLQSRPNCKKLHAWPKLVNKVSVVARCTTQSHSMFKMLFPIGMKFVSPRELISFDLWHLTVSPPIRKCIWVQQYGLIHSLHPVR